MGRENLVGIDLGTTFSVIAHLNAQGTATVIPNSDAEPLTPSAIYLEGNTAIVGQAAREAAASGSGDVAMFVKRELGRPVFSRALGGRQYRPETLSAIVLRKLKQDAERHIGPIHKAVITVPAFFDDTRRKATQDAGRIAGLEVLDIINEPTAAALSYAAEGAGATGKLIDIPGGQMTVLVYDLGGGTFDVTVVKLADKHFETIATDGAVKLGGKDWDDKVVEYVAQEFRQQFNANPLDDEQRRDVLAAQAEKAKRVLSRGLPSATIECFHEGHNLKVKLTREKFEKLTEGLLSHTHIVTDLVLQQAKLTWNQVDRILLVGGSTKMQMVPAMLQNISGKKPDNSLDPDQVVARGAAIHAGILAARGNAGELVLDDGALEELGKIVVGNVNAYSLGVAALKEDKVAKKRWRVNDILIPKNTRLPASFSRIYPLDRAGVSSVKVPILEGEAPNAEDNITIGECVISDLPPNLPARSPIQVRLHYDGSGRISVMALDMTGGRLAQVEIKREYGLTEADIERERAFVDSLTIQ
ncbi:MAG: Hsp70 family protein [Planctomycetes bacterium]|nr:Hsp70 family protein [Planctomycetota bacterium]